MSEKEIQDFLIEGRVAILATNGPSGYPHQVAMRYGVVDGKVCFETKAKSQKAVNLRRDPKLSISVEAGDSYDQLRGVAIDGTTRIIDDTSDPLYWAAGVNVFERYQAASVDALRDYRRNAVIGAEMCTSALYCNAFRSMRVTARLPYTTVDIGIAGVSPGECMSYMAVRLFRCEPHH